MLKRIIFIIMLLSGCTTIKTEVVYKNVYPTVPQLDSPLILKTNACKFSMPKDENDNIFVGFSKEQYKCYIKNQEINREQKLLYEKFIEEINKERAEWNKMNEN